MAGRTLCRNGPPHSLALRSRRRLQKGDRIRNALKTFLNHSDLTLEWKFQVYRSIFYALILYAMESIWLTPAQVARLERFHFLNMRSILGIKAAYISRVSHEDVHRQAHEKGLAVGSLAQVYISRSMKFLGHLLRHLDSMEANVIFDHAMRPRLLDQLVTPLRRGTPQGHWTEMTCVQAFNRFRYIRHDQVPPLTALHDRYCHTPARTEVWQQLGGSLYSFNSHCMSYLPSIVAAAQQKAAWMHSVGC